MRKVTGKTLRAARGWGIPPSWKIAVPVGRTLSAIGGMAYPAAGLINRRCMHVDILAAC
jgi:hypothetical protein